MLVVPDDIDGLDALVLGVLDQLQSEHARQAVSRLEDPQIMPMSELLMSCTSSSASTQDWRKHRGGHMERRACRHIGFEKHHVAQGRGGGVGQQPVALQQIITKQTARQEDRSAGERFAQKRIVKCAGSIVRQEVQLHVIRARDQNQAAGHTEGPTFGTADS